MWQIYSQIPAPEIVILGYMSNTLFGMELFLNSGM